MTEYSDTSIKILGRGMARRSLDLIEAMAAITEAAHPITGRGVGYKLFIAKLISSMAPQQMQRVYRLLKQARERGIVPWHHIVDEAREFERAPSWNDPEAFATVASQSYRRDSWNQQPVRCEVWSEKGTVRGVLEPVLDALGVGFRVMHGFSSATIVHDIAEGGDDGRKLIALYVGDWDPSGMYMSERDLPQRLEKYYGWHVEVKRIALTRDQVTGLPSFPATDKRKDPRFEWFRTHYGIQCWEIDALDPNVLRAVVEEEITALIEPNAWKRCEINNAAEQETLRKVLTNWANPRNSRRRK